MSVPSEIWQVIEEFNPLENSPADLVETCTEMLEWVTDPGKELDPRGSDERAQRACNAYGGVYRHILSKGYFSPDYARILLYNAWNRFAQIQREENIRIYRAGLGMYLAHLEISTNSPETGLRWALLTQADDLLGRHEKGGGAGKNLLQTFFGITDNTLQKLNNIATSNVDAIEDELGNCWQHPKGFAEDAVRQFLIDTDFVSMRLLTTSAQEIPLCPPYFKALLDEVLHATDKSEKGKALENLAAYLFLLNPGWAVGKNVWDPEQSSEYDLVISNRIAQSDLASEILGRQFLVECKNWKDSVTSEEVGYFLHKMNLTHCRFGVIFAQNGITGKNEVNDEKAARSLIRRTYHENGSLCIVIEEEHLNQLANETIKFWPTLLLREIDKFRFGSSRSQ